MRYFYLAFDSDFFDHINVGRVAEGEPRSKLFSVISALLKLHIVAITLIIFETFIAFVLWLPIPIYSSVVYQMVNQARGMPHYRGMYIRALYYKFRLKKMSPNVFIDQNVFFAFPSSVSLGKFCYIDKNAAIMAKSAQIGERVHICPGVFISGGGHFIAKDFSCVCAKAVILTSSEALKHGACASGPMTKASERLVVRGHVTIEKDAFVGVG